MQARHRPRTRSTPDELAELFAQQRSLRRMGWDVVEVWWRDVRDMSGAVADVREAFRRQRILLAKGG